MTLQNVLWIALSAAVSLVWVWYQYFYRAKNIPHPYLLAALRFLTLMGVFLLLIPLTLESISTYTEKHRLFVLADNSKSVGNEAVRKQLIASRDLLTGDPALSERLEVTEFVFGKELRNSDTLDFSENGTNITSALEYLVNAQPDQNASIVLLSDGVENQGRSLASSPVLPIPVYPVIVGDTTAYLDIRIDRLNLNRYAFLENQFPVEILVSYRGDARAQTVLNVLDNGKPAYRETLDFAGGRATKRISVTLPATAVGLHAITVVVEPLQNERNTQNNRLDAGIEVIDETTRISIVSRVAHPDIGALRRSIESNEQRQVRILRPEEAEPFFPETDLWILYQPDQTFDPVYAFLNSNQVPVMTLTGKLTDWNYLNEVQLSFRIQEAGPLEELLPESNPAFGYFDISEWEVSNYPPLEGFLGEYYIREPHEWLLGQRVRGVSLLQPLVALIKGSERREAVVFGSGIWKWRMSAYSRQGDFTEFDATLGKLWLFLTAGQETNRLTLDYQSLYNGQQPAVIRARYFDEALRFDPEATLNLKVFDSTGVERASYPLSLGRTYYEADISNLPAGTYSFNIGVEGTNYADAGQFRILAFDLENQQLQSDFQGMAQLAASSGGQWYFPENLGQLKDSLLNADRFRPLQRTRRNVVSLIDYRWLLALIAATLGAEWFIRKYNGLL
jgi:hypothetical protein